MWSDLLVFIAIGFAAQLVDGALGMAYGLITTSTLLSLGVHPATASASVHAAEVFTSGASGLSHWRLKNIDWALVKRLAPAGMAGGYVGAYVLSSVSSSWLHLAIAIYLFIMGIIVISKGLQKMVTSSKPLKHIPVIGFFGGLFDAIGGGGWGSLVTSNLLSQGANPRQAIGSTNISEFFVTFTISCTFMMTIGLELWPIILGLVIGGVCAAPIAAYAVKYISVRILFLIVGSCITMLSLRNIMLVSDSLFK